MAIFSDLPPEIWHLIAQYLPIYQLSRLRWLNSFFLNYWLDLKWKRVSFQINRNIDSKVAYRLLRWLKLPFVAQRTRMLSIVLITSASTAMIPDLNFYGGLGCALQSLTILPNLTSLNIKYTTFHLDNFFKAITSSSLKKTLQELSLTGRVKMFASIQEYCTHKSPFDNLTKLTLELHAADEDEGSQLESSLTLEPFLRSIAPTLQSLTIINESFTLDLSLLFNALSKPDSPVLFPKLTYLSLCLHFSTSFQTSSQSFRHFLRANNHLHHLHLDMSTSVHTVGEDEDEQPLGSWFADLVNDNVHFPSLQTLDIYPSKTQTGRSALLSLIKLTVPTLSSLIVSGLCLKFETVDEVIAALTGCEGQPQTLKSLTLNITELSVPLLELIARKLPQLEKLTLLFGQVANMSSFCELLRKRRYNRVRDGTSSQDVFHAWKLRDLKISGWDDDLDESAIRAVAGAIPALVHLRGEDSDSEFDDNEL